MRRLLPSDWIILAVVIAAAAVLVSALRVPQDPAAPSRPAPAPDAAVMHLTGLVRNRAGDPVAGAEVRLFSLPGVLRTDENGSFAFDALESQHQMLQGLLIRASGFAYEYVPLNWRRRSLDITLDPGFEIRGRLVDPGGGEVSNRRIDIDSLQSLAPDSAAPEASVSLLRLFGSECRYTAADGTFHFDQLPDGRYVLSYQESYGTERSDVEAAAGDTDVRLTIGGTRAGSVEVSGRVTDALSGALIEGAAVQAMSTGGYLGLGEVKGVHRTAADGRFRLTGLEPGEYVLRCSARGYAVGTVTVSLVEGEPLEVHIDLRPARSVDVRVFDSLGRAASGALVSVLDESGEMLVLENDSDLLSMGLLADDHGAVLLRGLPAEIVTLEVAHSRQHVPEQRRIDLTAEGPHRIDVHLSTVPDDQDLRLVDVSLLTEEGTWAVVPSRCTVLILDEKGERWGSVTGEWEEGSFWTSTPERRRPSDWPILQVEVPMTPCMLRIQTPGYADAEVAIPAGGGREMDVRLVKAR